MSFLPGSFTPALLCSCHRKVISHSDGHSVVGCRRKQKEPITQSIRNRRERGSRFKMMFYVIGSEDQSRVLLSTAPANRTKGVVEQFGTSGVPIPCRMTRLIMSQYGRTFLFSCYVAAYRCAIIIQIMYYTVKIAKPPHYIRNYRERKSTVAKKFSLPVRTFSREISTGKKILSNMGRIFKTNFPTTCREYKSSLPTKLVGSLKSHFCPTWTEVENHFAQVAPKLHKQLRHRLCWSCFYT